MASHHSIRRILALCLLIASCRSFAPASPTPSAQPPLTSDSVTPFVLPPSTKSPTPAPGYVELIRNAQYQLGATEGLRVVQLKDGKFEQGKPGDADFISVTVTDFIAKGVFDGAGDIEYAVLVSENYGGSGSFVFLAVYLDAKGTPKFMASAMVDDRPQLNDLSMEDANQILLDVVVHGPQDPMCCPALRTLRHYRLDKLGPLVMSDYTTFTPDGRPRTITISAPAFGTEVYSSIQIKGSVAIAPFENNLVYRIFDVGGIELSSGALSVSAADPGAPGTFNATIPIGNALSGAVIRLEVQDINAADDSLFAMDSVELVVK